MGHKDRLINVFKRPGMYGLRGSYREYVAYLCGFSDHTTDGLKGFSRWIAREKLGYGDNILWWSQAEIIYCAQKGIEREDMVEDELIALFFELFTEFLDSEDGRAWLDGLPDVGLEVPVAPTSHRRRRRAARLDGRENRTP